MANTEHAGRRESAHELLADLARHADRLTEVGARVGAPSALIDRARAAAGRHPR